MNNHLIKKNPLVSIIIRTKNEERWLSSCLKAVFSQTYSNIEVVIVDNMSTDRTVDKANAFPVKIISTEIFIPGKAINDGIRASNGEVIVCLSGHCIPVDKNWLINLISPLFESCVGGVYGRQQPLSFSSDLDKRDLILIFGLDRKIQIKDSFFHNANSAFMRAVWEDHPFCENATNIEDRLWGEEIIQSGMRIIYEPDASVYHWHGIHQNLSLQRCKNIVRILERIPRLYLNQAAPNTVNNIVCIIPIRGKGKILNGIPLLKVALDCVKKSKFINSVYVSTDDETTAEQARLFGAKASVLRPLELSEEHIDIMEVMRFTLEKIEQIEAGSPDLVIVLEEGYPFRRSEHLDLMVVRILDGGFDTVIASIPEQRGIWSEKDDGLELMGEGFMPRSLKTSKNMVGLVGYGCITYPALIRENNIFGLKTGLFELESSIEGLEIKSQNLDFSFEQFIQSK